MDLRFEELTDEEWRFIEPIFPSQPEKPIYSHIMKKKSIQLLYPKIIDIKSIKKQKQLIYNLYKNRFLIRKNHKKQKQK
ncbi:MAG: hypothetical protein BTN85_1300 [Candidatus Methanohalarchaeum thermophilum]|uniref:Uncharacterized protein n=1 Tax=Methanohalarchaeum thermophilum TaxID=1903181 RepID=A0A1Q6DWS2_METT1|nr:MAG: hypothetical protein BTN85_1300 [Candidatus Methanohalarchaeum thermophilum]